MNEEEKANIVYFFDTYAFFEIIAGNKSYLPYQEAGIITIIFNIAEFIVDVEFSDIVNAVDLKIKNKNLSIPDAVGYIIAKKYGVRFLTGDEDFRNFDTSRIMLAQTPCFNSRESKHNS